jgi:hypothetical protein
MAYEFDDDAIRARVEKRLAPLKKLRRLRLWLLLNVGMFLSFLVVSQSYRPDSSIFWEVLQKTGTHFSSTTQKWEDYTYASYQPYPLVVFILVAWFALVVIHAIQVWAAFRHEGAIRREMERETNLELERLRLQVELAKNQRLARGDEDDEAVPLEKIKRAARLGDDGELLSEESPRATRREQV